MAQVRGSAALLATTLLRRSEEDLVHEAALRLRRLRRSPVVVLLAGLRAAGAHVDVAAAELPRAPVVAVVLAIAAIAAHLRFLS